VFVQYLAPLLHIQKHIFGTTASYLWGYSWLFRFIFRMVWLAKLLQEGMIDTTASYAGGYDWHYCFICRRVWFRISVRKPTVMTEVSCLAQSPQTKFRAAQYVSCTSCQVHQSRICRSVCISYLKPLKMALYIKQEWISQFRWQWVTRYS